jgi:predicted nuclease with TOPRIM domain
MDYVSIIRDLKRENAELKERITRMILKYNSLKDAYNELELKKNTGKDDIPDFLRNIMDKKT